MDRPEKQLPFTDAVIYRPCRRRRKSTFEHAILRNGGRISRGAPQPHVSLPSGTDETVRLDYCW